ncbi:hypothetical protein [Bacillus sp. B1-b2]|uniref:hypothetical protein n=1 Tax=Bacillus sp. B1-b2 TaxID=2653201 RepID=UPI0012613C2B|nr:hypothetical protein [Bacillus sp. B1-b2]KAB7670787.1 hypothetical protein F9279_08215 [Bacillus sp. B1-b2]
MKKKLKKKKRVKRSSWLGKYSRESIAGLTAFISVLFFIITIILWGISELIDENFIISEMIGAYSVTSIFLCFSIMFIAIIIGTRNWFAKIICFFIVSFMLLGSYSFIETATLIYKDKTAFENKQFKKIVAVPTGAEFDDPEHGTEFLMELEFNDLTLDVYSLDISRSYYHENLSGKSLEISYLPNSHYAVSVREYLEEAEH